jgi:hypothetical protein
MRELDVLRMGRFSYPEWELFEEVSLGTGRVDAVAVNLWRSRGHHVVGLEVKRSRSDWLRELREPSKADTYWRHFNRFYVVTPPGVVKVGELPTGWGLLVVKGDRSYAETEPDPKKASIDRAALASILKAARRHFVDSRDRDQELRGEYQRGFDAGRAAKDEARSKDATLAEAERLRRMIAEFREQTGLEISEWGLGRTAEIVTLLRKTERLEHLLSQWRDHGALMNEATAALERIIAARRGAPDVEA